MTTHLAAQHPCCRSRDDGGYLCELPLGHSGSHRATFGADDEGPIPDRVWDDPMTTTTPAPPPVEALVADLEIAAETARFHAAHTSGTEDQEARDLAEADRLDWLIDALPGLMADAEKWRRASRQYTSIRDIQESAEMFERERKEPAHD